MSNVDVFRRITAALDRAGIAYMLTGSFASVHYGAPRSTQDIDIVIEADADKLKSFAQSLHRDQYYADINTALEALRRESMFNVIDLATGWKIDLILRKSRPFSKEEFGRRHAIDLEGIKVMVASPEDLIIAKLEWAKAGKSQRQIEDAAAIFRLRGDDLDHVYIERWVAHLQLSQQWNAARLAAGSTS
jgi:hypothetical protein